MFRQNMLEFKRSLEARRQNLPLIADPIESKFERRFIKRAVEKRRMYLQQRGLCCLCDQIMSLMHHGNHLLSHSATREHLTPRSCGGTDAKTNIRLSCHRCNSKRGVMDFAEFRQWIAERAERKKVVKKRKFERKLYQRQARYLTDPEYRAKVDQHGCDPNSSQIRVEFAI